MQRQSPPDQFSGLSFRNIGPATMGGRIDDLAVLETNPAVFYVGTATGGLWKTTNNGTTWEVLFDDQDDVVSIGDVAIAPNDANTVWVGSGENNNRQSSSWGNGVYKSTDGGAHLEADGAARLEAHRAASSSTRSITTSSTSPRSAASGDRARSAASTRPPTAALTWTNVLFVDEDTGATELVMDPVEQQGALRRDLSAAARDCGASTAAAPAAPSTSRTRCRPAPGPS